MLIHIDIWTNIFHLNRCEVSSKRANIILEILGITKMQIIIFSIFFTKFYWDKMRLTTLYLYFWFFLEQIWFGKTCTHVLIFKNYIYSPKRKLRILYSSDCFSSSIISPIYKKVFNELFTCLMMQQSLNRWFSNDTIFYYEWVFRAKDLSLWHKLWIFNPYIFSTKCHATFWCKPLIFQT